MKHQKYKKRQWWTSSIEGTAFGLVVSAAILLIMTSMVDKAYLSLDASKIVIFITQLISGLLSSLIAGRTAGDRGAVACIASAAGYALILLVVSMLFMDGLHGNVLLGLGVIALGAAVGMSLLFKKPTRHRRKRNHGFR